MIRSVDDRPRRSVESALRDDFRLELLRFRYLGYLSYRALLWAGVVSGGGLVGFVGVLSMTRWALTVIAILVTIALGLLVVGVVVMRAQRVTVVREEGLYIAKDDETGLIRHGETASEALQNLGTAVALHEYDQMRTD